MTDDAMDAIDELLAEMDLASQAHALLVLGGFYTFGVHLGGNPLDPRYTLPFAGAACWYLAVAGQYRVHLNGEQVSVRERETHE